MKAHNWIGENNQLRKALFAEQEKNRELLKENLRLRNSMREIASGSYNFIETLEVAEKALKGGEA